MPTVTSGYEEEIFRQVQGLPDDKIREILDFIYFIKAKDAIDPSQIYFWTRQWQEMERQADSDKQKGNIIGDGSVSDLLEELHK